MVKDLYTLLVLLLAAMAFATNGIYFLDEEFFFVDKGKDAYFPQMYREAYHS